MQVYGVYTLFIALAIFYNLSCLLARPQAGTRGSYDTADQILYLLGRATLSRVDLQIAICGR